MLGRRLGALFTLVGVVTVACHESKLGQGQGERAPASATATASVHSAATALPSAVPSAAVPPSIAGPANAIVVPARQTVIPGGLAPGERRPLVVVLHGLGASGQIAFDALRLAEFGARHRVFVLAPDGTQDSAGRRFWNASAACCNFDRRPVDDVSRLAALIDVWRARDDVDPRRISVIGHSNGGFMAHRLACALGDRLAAAVSMSGAGPTPSEPCAPVATIAVLELHGDADEIVRYAGGTVFDRRDMAAFPSARQTFLDWSRRLGCAGDVERGPALDLDPKLAGAETQVERAARCSHGAVELWTARGASHYIGTRASALETIWTFIESHPKP